MAATIRLAAGLHRGLVQDYSPPDNTIKVIVKGDGNVIPCVWAAGIISGMLGLKTSYLPPVKTEVIVWWPPKSAFGYIVGTLPSIQVDPGRQQRTILGDPDSNFTKQQVFHVGTSKDSQVFVGHKPPVDLAEGELHMDNLLGVGLSLLRNMASIQAGDLARVECHVMDDMVRVLSDTFKHYSAFGDYSISNDGGKLNVVWNGTSNDYEAWGNRDAQSARAGMNNPTDVNQKLTATDQSDDGRWRFTQYIGWLGGFIHTFFTDPVDALGKIAENQFRSGKAHFHVNDDGAILVQTVADIVLEKVVRIPVPVPIRRENDPKGNLSDTTLALPAPTWKPSDSDNLFEMAFQLREYARWLNNSCALSRFRQLDREWQIPSETDTPAPDINSAEADRKKANGGAVNWQTVYSTIRIYRDGSIQTVDAYGNAITTTKVGIQISTPKDLYLQAGGSVNIVAGRDFNVVAQKNVNLSAVTAAVRLSSKTAMQFFCTAGNIVYELASGFWHKFVGQVDVNNTVAILLPGTVVAATEVKAPLLSASSGMNTPQVTATTVTISSTLSVPNLVVNSVAEGAGSLPIPAIDVTLPSVSDTFEFQSDYAPGDLYQTVTQQQQVKKDSLTSTPNVWDFASNEIPSRGTPWPGKGVQEKATQAGAELSTPSGDKSFTNEPAALAAQNIKIQTA